MEGEEDREGKASRKRTSMAAQEVTENAKQAREQALIGCYDEAKVFYAGAIQGIQQLLVKEKHDQATKEKWKQVSHDNSVRGGRELLVHQVFDWCGLMYIAGTKNAD